ncbi:MAG: hypothetical protein RLY31_1574 [Bacteroidota bacterium]|jgi:cyclophilin family peptidyl-prolyl cis-trans isomerase/HEAT repeat protein
MYHIKHLPALVPVVLLSFLTFSCVPPSEEGLLEVDVDFTNPLVQELYTYQDKGMVDSLLRYFKDKNPTMRYLAVQAFASQQDTAAVDSLGVMLYDPVDEVRVAAAYALGQLRHKRAVPLLTAAFDRYDTTGISFVFNGAVLEAIGKCGSSEQLDNLAAISTYRQKDTLLLEGQARGIYQFMLRGLVSENGTNTMVRFLHERGYPARVRGIAAHYLMRAKGIDLAMADSLLPPTLAKEDDPNIRMALASAIGKAGTPKALNVLLYQYNLERDDRVKCNILRAFENFDHDKVKPTVLMAINDPSLMVASTAADYLIRRGAEQEATIYWQLAKQPGRPWQVALKLYAAATRYLPYSMEEPRKYLNWELKKRFENAVSPYEKGEALRALAHFGWNYRYIRDAAYPSDLAVVRTAAVEALAMIARMPDFSRLFGSGSQVRRELSDCFRDAIETGDLGMAAVAAQVLREPQLGFRQTFDSLQILENALRKLRLPQEIETYNEIKQTLDYFQGNPQVPVQPKFSHRIDWKLVSELQPSSRVRIRTEKGDVVLQLLPEAAPGSVANFLELIRDQYFDGKTFHRVVPNFVAQGGCPRGDGYGSLNYCIRTEVPYLHYDQEGCVGMASAGLHTEGTQFFITHSPTPHLDGRYTIFARVVEGMEVVYALSVGDKIDGVSLETPK